MGDLARGLMRVLFGDSNPAAPPTVDDADFADFAGAPDPVPLPSFSPISATPVGQDAALPTRGSTIPYTRWYRIWERTSPSDFYQEAFVLPFIALFMGAHIWGRRKNKAMARGWIEAHAPVLKKEFAVVGYDGLKGSNDHPTPLELLKEKTAQEYTTYATGRQNVAFVDMKVSLLKRYNPMTWLLEVLLSLFFDSIKAPVERMEATSYTFDGKEKDLLPTPPKGEPESRSAPSSYDSFVWALVNKGTMRQLREDRYDISLTTTKDHPKLPNWASVMSESAEVTDLLLTPELIKAVEEAGFDLFEHLIVTDQPIDKPLKLHETIPRKRLSLSLRLPSSTSSAAYAPTMNIFSYFLRLPDTLVSSAHFRPEVTRKIKATREEESRKLRKQDEEEKAEERKLEGDKKKKEQRDAKLKAMGPEQQKKFLEAERKHENKRNEKRMTKKG